MPGRNVEKEPPGLSFYNIIRGNKCLAYKRDDEKALACFEKEVSRWLGIRTADLDAFLIYDFK